MRAEPLPMVVGLPGPEVTAAGVLADVLRELTR